MLNKINRIRTQNIHVSTVFLGLDHSVLSDEPIVFETMIFGGKRDGEILRYASYDLALHGHSVMEKHAVSI